jgi:hypothetical protein
MRQASSRLRTQGKKHFRKIKNVFVMRLLPSIIHLRPDESASRPDLVRLNLARPA